MNRFKKELVKRGISADWINTEYATIQIKTGSYFPPHFAIDRAFNLVSIDQAIAEAEAIYNELKMYFRMDNADTREQIESIIERVAFRNSSSSREYDIIYNGLKAEADYSLSLVC